MLATIIATMTPALCSALVITLIPPFFLSKIGKALSLMATGLLLTLSFTHLLPEALEGGADLHLIGLVVWGTIMVLIGLEMFFNSNHQRTSCPVCAAELQVRHAGHLFPHLQRNNNNNNNNQDQNQALGSITSIRPFNGDLTDALQPINPRFVPVLDSSAHHEDTDISIHCSCCAPLHDSCYSSVHCPTCSADHTHKHPQEHEHTHDHALASTNAFNAHSHNLGTLHHWGHSHEFSLHSSDIEAIQRQAAHQEGSIKTALTQGGAPILAGSIFHAMCDGIVIASAFALNSSVGIAITSAILAHELPQQLSNYVLMLSLGMNRLQGYIVNLVSLTGSLMGGLIFALILEQAKQVLPFALAIAAGSFIYVALSDILPRLNRPESKRLMGINYSCLLLGAILAMILSHH